MRCFNRHLNTISTCRCRRRINYNLNLVFFLISTIQAYIRLSFRDRVAVFVLFIVVIPEIKSS